MNDDRSKDKVDQVLICSISVRLTVGIVLLSIAECCQLLLRGLYVGAMVSTSKQR